MEDLPFNESEILEEAYYNSYRIITNKVSFDELMDEGSYAVLVHDPDKDITRDVIQDVIDYFAKYEEYELCAELKQELDKKIIS